MTGVLTASLNFVQDVPDDYKAGSTSKWLFTIWAGGFALLVLPYCIYRISRHGDAVPLFVWLGSLPLTLGEPMLDHLGHLWWADNLPLTTVHGYGLSVPLLNAFAYVFFIGMSGYFGYRMFLRGMTASQVWLLWLGFCALDFVLEVPGTAASVYDYYGRQPLEVWGFPLHWAWLNGTGMLAVGFLLYLMAPRLRGIQQALIMLIPFYGFLGAYGMVAWPAFLSLNYEMSSAAQVLVSLGSLALALPVVWQIAEYVGRSSPVAAAAEPRMVPAREIKVTAA